jgi:uncharacterized membrane protein
MSVAMSSARLLRAIAGLALAGAVVSGVSLAHHYSTSQSSFCDFSEKVNCDIVNRSEYSTLLGVVPVALVGILGYLALLGAATIYRRLPETPKLLFWGATAGFLFALYLTYIEGFVLYTWCILCLSSLAIIFSITVLSFVLMAVSKREGSSA